MRKILKKLRAENDFTQDDMAKRLGVSRTTYCNIERENSKGSLDFWLGVTRAFPKVEAEVMEKLKERAEREKEAKGCA